MTGSELLGDELGVRLAGPADRQRCADLLSQAIQGAREVRGGALLQTLGLNGAPQDEADADSLVERWTASPADAAIFAGTYDGEVVGIGAGTVSSGAPGPGRLGQVVCCYVEEDYREVGLGGALVQALMEWFEERGCGGVDVLALPGDRATKQRFEAAGFKARLLLLHRRLG